jgi:hypothetical protein
MQFEDYAERQAAVQTGRQMAFVRHNDGWGKRRRAASNGQRGRRVQSSSNGVGVRCVAQRPWKRRRRQLVKLKQQPEITIRLSALRALS